MTVHPLLVHESSDTAPTVVFDSHYLAERVSHTNTVAKPKALADRHRYERNGGLITL